jgi:hypothetical protein
MVTISKIFFGVVNCIKALATLISKIKASQKSQS